MHGAYDQGAAPTGGIFEADDGRCALAPCGCTASVAIPIATCSSARLGGRLSVVEAHEGSGLTEDVGMCGLPTARPGAVVLDGWTAAMLGDLAQF
jgi:hypothetical protein